ncbi:MAG: hypothetical protein HOB49_12560, partial [Gemmatimonadetes bacterium]|nr:hypothetical protein [Gemmatimonadota bacterium]
LYSNILNQAAGKPVMFRTLDIGGDKQLPYFQNSADQNPNMGWRAIRVALDQPSILRQQLRALINAADGRELSVMFPMVSEVAEFDAAKAVLEKELVRVRSRGGVVPEKLHVGVMLEVPGLMWQLKSLLPRVDFLSVGSNDLFQFLFASDRVGQADIHAMDRDGANQRPLSNHPSFEVESAYDPDGSRIVFTTDRDNHRRLYVMDPDGTNQRPLEATAAGGDDPAFSPDGQWIAFTSQRDGENGIFVMRADGTESRRVSPLGLVATQGSFSPDASQLVFAGQVDGKPQLHRIDVDGSNLINLSDNDFEEFAAHWGPELSV